MKRRIPTVIRMIAVSLVPSALMAQADTTPDPQAGQGFYTEEQADRGEEAFEQVCGFCHSASEFSGSRFMRSWGGAPVGQFFELVRGTMPMDAPGSLSLQQYTDIIAYLLSRSDLPEGDTELPADPDALMEIRIEPAAEPGAAAPTGTSVPDSTVVYDYEEDLSGQAPEGFSPGLTGGGDPADWRVAEVADAPSGNKVVAQLSDDRTNERYPHLVREGWEAKDVDLSVRFKTISGEVDASGGLVFRYQDESNYYVVRANALEGNVVAYKTENGQRSNIGVRGREDAYGMDAVVPHGEWMALRVIARGDVFEIFLDDRKLFEVQNDTFQDAGRIGLWTKADAVTHFDDLRATSLEDGG